MTSPIGDAFAGDTSTTLTTQIGQMAHRLEEIASDMGKAKDEDTARFDALKAEQTQVAATLTTLKAKHDADARENDLQVAIDAAKSWTSAARDTREPSMALRIGGGNAKARSEGYVPGTFIGNVYDSASRDYRTQEAGKAVLSGLTEHQASQGKSTLGATDAAGGWIIPNAIVDTFIAPATVTNIYRGLMTVVPGVTAYAVDIPFRSAVRTRAAIAAFGATKENVDIAYNGYTATMHTLARIYDIGNQFLRQSRGAAEADVLSELAAAFAQGEAYYIREGTGSSQPYGYTAALTNGPGAFRSTFTASATTLAGSMAVAIATAAGALAGRGASPTAAVMSASSYWTMVAQGTDTAGFFFAEPNGVQGIRPGTLISPFGLPVYPDADADLEGTAAVVDNLVVADWKQFKVYFGENYRVDSSDVAGTRWDTNITGFRGEEEMGFDARPTVYAGYAQMITDITP